MKKNMGIADRIIRLVLALILSDIAFSRAVTGGWLIVIWIFAVVMLVTSLAGRCPLYSLLHIHTNRNTHPL